MCPECTRARIQDVSSYLDLDREIRAYVCCKCGYKFKAVLERRKNHRKPVNLPGTYWTERRGLSRNCTIKDISRTGVRFNVATNPDLNIGDKVWVEFRLDTPQRTQISKRVIIRNKKKSDYGVEFLGVDPNNATDRSIGFYLM